MAQPVVTVCPACGTRFRVSGAQLSAANGRVRCGACLEVFDAEQHALSAPAEPVSVVDNGQAPADGEPSADVPKPELLADDAASLPEVLPSRPPLRFEVVDTNEQQSAAIDSDPRRRRRAVLDGSLEPGLDESNRSQFDVLAAAIEQQPLEPERRRLRGWLIGLGIVLLVVAQALYFRIDTWSSDARIRPVYEALCTALGCRVPLYFDPRAMHSTNVLLRAHPDRNDLLLVDLEIVNRAPYPQAFPQLRLALLGRDGREIGSRIFEPADYRSGELATMPDVPPNTPLQIAVEMFRPRGEVAQYRFELVPQRGDE